MTVRRDSGAVLITGAARRIGRCIALDLARDGWAVAIHCNTSLHDAGTLKSEIEAAGGSAVIVQGNLAEAQVPERLVAEAVAALGPLTCLVNNASRFEPDEAGSVTLDSWAAHLDTNLRAPVFLSQHFAAQLPADSSGNIINIIDQRVWKLTPKFFSYTASKSALWTVTRTLAQALAPRIRVNAIGPGPALPNVRMDEEDFARQMRLTLLKRGTSPEEISSAVKYILSAPAMTGQMIVLDGGQHLLWQTRDVTEVKE
ncbi:SDR family oxidoreductase [Taklimakanibacter albus]|uniref:SDR family oxidoreductase n=1 Tax=Taklimakanibacter albus TaxID=2800327 RepID=A0ACC5R497_9HYPH|nr:SDR family oxidoreductase [Aestuariivirga sp. YIM B02566]MBK1867496.1 SDR family oxidoreductase [Aestuariivirga sp. YIM B02566]